MSRVALMNSTHLHLALNHIPVLGTVFGMSLLAYGLWRRSEELKRVALGVYVIVAIMSIPVYLSGEAAENIVEGLPGVEKSDIERHDQAAGVAFTGVLVLGGVGLFGLRRFRQGTLIPVRYAWGTLIASLVVSGLMAWTANLGGRIQHMEIRASLSPSAKESPGSPS